MPLVAADGILLAMKGSSAESEIEAARRALTALGCAAPQVVELMESEVSSPTSAVRVAWADPGKVVSEEFARSAFGSRPKKNRGRRK
jgi:16S rRNA (guanine527-N7)-methyltransferase